MTALPGMSVAKADALSPSTRRRALALAPLKAVAVGGASSDKAASTQRRVFGRVVKEKKKSNLHCAPLKCTPP